MLMNSELPVTDLERDPAVLVNSLMKLPTHCEAAVKKVDSMFGIIQKESK